LRDDDDDKAILLVQKLGIYNIYQSSRHDSHEDIS